MGQVKNKHTITTWTLGLTIGLVACSSHKKSDDPSPKSASNGDAVPFKPPQSSPGSVSALIGIWHFDQCAQTAANSSTKDLMVFQDGVVITAHTTYSDAACSVMVSTTTLQGKYLEGAAGPSGGTKLDLLYNQRTVTYPDRAAADKALASYTKGPTALCTGGAVPTASGSIIDLTPCFSQAAALYQYTVYTATAAELHLALPSAEASASGKDAGSRAVKLDGALVLSKG
jgi:hypothetical protein